MVGLLGIMVFEKEAYGSEEWQTYLSYNDERSMVYDYYGVPAYEENREFYEKIGLKEYDVENLKELGFDRKYIEKYIPYVVNLTEISLQSLLKVFWDTRKNFSKFHFL